MDKRKISTTCPSTVVPVKREVNVPSIRTMAQSPASRISTLRCSRIQWSIEDLVQAVDTGSSNPVTTMREARCFTAVLASEWKN